MCGVTGTENVTPSAAAASTASPSRANGTVGDLPDAHLFRSAGALIPALQRYFQGGHHHFQLAGILRIGKRNVTMRLAAAGARPPFGPLLHPLFEGCQLHERVGRGREKSLRVRASASLIRAPVFHRVVSSILR